MTLPPPGQNRFDQFFDDEDESYEQTSTRWLPQQETDSTLNTTRALEQSYTRMTQANGRGNAMVANFITAEILLQAPENYFDRFEEIVALGVTDVQNQLSDGRSAVVAVAKDDPTNEEAGQKAYSTVHSYAVQFMDRHLNFSGIDRQIAMALIAHEIIGFGKLDPLWRDSTIDEILVNGPKDVQVEIGGKILKVPSCKFRDERHLMALIDRLYSAIGKQVARTTPIVDGRLHDNSRMAVVHSSVAPAGPNFSIRRHKEDYLPPQKFIEWNAASPELLTFLGNLIYKGASVLIIGGTSSGKTTLMGALSGFIRPDHRVLTLEDNLELKLAPQKFHAAAMETLPAPVDRPHGGVTMRDLVKASLRMRPNAIIIGEVRDGAAYDLCQALNTGHYGMSTIHANSEFAGIYKLISLVSQGGLMQGDAAMPLIAASFDFIVQVERFPSDGSRKVTSVSEVPPFPTVGKNGQLELPLTQLWSFKSEPLAEDLKVQGEWVQVADISEARKRLLRLDMERDLTWEELKTLSQPDRQEN